MQKCILCYSPIFKKDKKQFPYAFSLTYSRAQQELKQKKITFKYRTGVISTRSWIVPAPLVTFLFLLNKMASKNPQKE